MDFVCFVDIKLRSIIIVQSIYGPHDISVMKNLWMQFMVSLEKGGTLSTVISHCVLYL